MGLDMMALWMTFKTKVITVVMDIKLKVDVRMRWRKLKPIQDQKSQINMEMGFKSVDQDMESFYYHN